MKLKFGLFFMVVVLLNSCSPKIEAKLSPAPGLDVLEVGQLKDGSLNRDGFFSYKILNNKTSERRKYFKLINGLSLEGFLLFKEGKMPTDAFANFSLSLEAAASALLFLAHFQPAPGAVIAMSDAEKPQFYNSLAGHFGNIPKDVLDTQAEDKFLEIEKLFYEGLNNILAPYRH